jgi:hypothetical protein
MASTAAVLAVGDDEGRERTYKSVYLYDVSLKRGQWDFLLSRAAQTVDPTSNMHLRRFSRIHFSLLC